MKRRTFLGAIATASLGVFMPIPKWIGEQAGGMFVPPPDDLRSILDFTEWRQDFDMAARHRMGFSGAVWAAPGDSLGSLQMFGGPMVVSNVESHSANATAIIRAREEMFLKSMRECMDSHHDPGWFKVTTHRYNDDGDIIDTEDAWKRIGYLRWVQPSVIRVMA